MEYKKNCDTLYEKDSLNDAKQVVPNNQALKAGGRYSDDRYSNIQKADNDGAEYALDNGDKSDPGPNQWCTWKVIAVVFIALTVLLLVTVLIVAVIWLRDSDTLAVSQKTSMERTKQRQEEEEQKRVEREREIRAEEEQKRVGKEREIRAEEEQKRVELEQELRQQEEQKRVELEQEIRQEEKEKREALERLLGERERRLEEVRAQCNSGQAVSSSSTGLSVLLSVLLLSCLLNY
ncbi:uncharacterized protein LOC134083291 [Sardina pilchardus]|uniref:uncharacterized protein LOC134083291 n=1 Tax=Sardina pilchardus TaxID=27697 RepID=UPI002E0F228F